MINHDRTRYNVFNGELTMPIEPTNPIIGGDTRISKDGMGKMAYFASGGEAWKAGLTDKSEVQQWRKEYSLCDCLRCYDRECTCREKNIRFPASAGGRDQCLRYARTLIKYAFRNPDGTVIIIPDEIIEAIRGDERK